MEGLELNEKPFMITETFHSGKLPQIFSGCTIDKDNIIISAIKRSENDDGYIIRCYECAGRDTQCRICISQFNLDQVFSFGHNEIKTIMISDAREIKEVDMLERG